MRSEAMAHDDLAAALKLYVAHCASSGAASASREAPQPKWEWRAPKTHLHAEMVKRRKDPKPSEKRGVKDALAALATGDLNAVEELLARRDDTPVAEEWQSRYKDGAQAYWDQFYREKNVNFFKDRHYLREEFGELMPKEVLADPRRWVAPLAGDDPEIQLDAVVDDQCCVPAVGSKAPPVPREPRDLEAAMQGRTVLLELGCAVGNGLFPLLRANPDLFVLACDLSPVAVELLRQKVEYQCGRCFAFSCDIAREEPPTLEHVPLQATVPAECVDFATLLFVLSAIDPVHHEATLTRICSRLKPGGVILIRDYGRGDLAQLRFSPSNWLGGDTYVRGDGTLAHFFTIEGLERAFTAAGLESLGCEYRHNEIINRGTGVVMPRVWVQGRFRRPLA